MSVIQRFKVAEHHRVSLTSSRREWLFVLSTGIFLILLMLLPYSLGYLNPAPGTTFTGIIMNPEDTQTYFAKMLQGYDGQWRYRIPFTPEAHEPVFIGTVYLALGHLARLSGLSLDTMWHLSRIAADLVLFLTTYWFIAAFAPERGWRSTIYLLALFGSGLGWVVFLLNQPYWLGVFPVDFRMPEAHLFFTAFTFPHVALGTSLLLVSMRLLWRIQEGAVERLMWGTALGAGLSNLLLVLVYPFLIYLVLLTNVLYFVFKLWQNRRFALKPALQLAITVAIPAPLLLYYAYVLQRNEVFRAWDAQALTASPPWPHYVLAFGPLLLFALLSLRWRARPKGYVYLWTWLLAAVLLLYAPLNPQRRFVQGAHVALSILAVTGFLGVAVPWMQETRFFRRLLRYPRYSADGLSHFLTVLFLAFMGLSNLYVLASVSITAAVQQPYPLFRLEDEAAGVEWLRQNTDRAIVLGAYQTGNYVAARAGNSVVLGHWAETMDYTSKQAEVRKFFTAETSDEWRQQLLRRYGVSYVWHGPQERALGSFAPDSVSYLKPVFQHGEISIYRLQQH